MSLSATTLKFAAALLILAAPLSADIDGGQPLAFLKRALGARPAAYGGAHTAVSDDAYGMFYNPAGLARLDHLEIGSQAAFLPAGRQFHLLSVVQPTRSRSMAYGVAWARLDLGNQLEKRVKNTPEPDSYFNDSQDAFFLALAAKLPVKGAAWGINVKYLSHQLGEADGNGFGLDAGLFYAITPAVDLAVAVEDAYTRLDWSTGYGENAALQTRLAAAAHFFDRRLSLLTEAEINTQQAIKGRAGLEWWALPHVAALRAGWEVNRASAGLGMTYPLSPRWDATLDYAFATDPALPDQFSHRLSMTLAFNLAPPRDMVIKEKEAQDSGEESARGIPEDLGEGDE